MAAPVGVSRGASAHVHRQLPASPAACTSNACGPEASRATCARTHSLSFLHLPRLPRTDAAWVCMNKTLGKWRKSLSAQPRVGDQ